MRVLEDELDDRISELTDEIEDLTRDIRDFVDGLERQKSRATVTWKHENSQAKLPVLLGKYEIWYNSSYPLVNEYLPERTDEFVNRYEGIRRGVELDPDFFIENDIESESALHNLIFRGLYFQQQLVASIPPRAKIEQYRITRSISSEITSEEVQKAKELYDDEDIRAAGVICGVAIERHLIMLCESSSVELEFEYTDGIYSLSQTLHSAGEISDDRLRLLEYISGIRNKCSHASEEEPQTREVERMLQEADNIIRQN